MRREADIMGMPAVIEAFGEKAERSIDRAFQYLRSVDDRFSTYKEGSEISRINRGEITPALYSAEVTKIFELAQETKLDTSGFFDIERPDGLIDPSGLVKGWAIRNASDLLRAYGHEDHYVEIAGDIQVSGHTADGSEWAIGIRNPFNRDEIVKVVKPRGAGIATSGTAARGSHIYDPHTGQTPDPRVVSLTVIGPDVYEADRFATAAFAMGLPGIEFLESLDGFEAYLIDRDGTAIMTSGFEAYV